MLAVQQEQTKPKHFISVQVYRIIPFLNQELNTYIRGGKWQDLENVSKSYCTVQNIHSAEGFSVREVSVQDEEAASCFSGRTE